MWALARPTRTHQRPLTVMKGQRGRPTESPGTSVCLTMVRTRKHLPVTAPGYRGAYALLSSVYVCGYACVCVRAEGELPPENPAAGFGFGFGFPVGAGAGAGAGALFEAPDPFASAGSMFDPMDPFATGAGTFTAARHSRGKSYANARAHALSVTLSRVFWFDWCRCRSFRPRTPASPSAPHCAPTWGWSCDLPRPGATVAAATTGRQVPAGEKERS
jgi:hypothetical protein